jgi:gluconokinase
LTDRPIVILLMGVAGSGKTTIGTLLARTLGWQFIDADVFHSAANIAKMRQGIPLTDADRQPWLTGLKQAIAQSLQAETPTVLACSALKQEYRDFLTQRSPQVQIVYLKGSADLLKQRLTQRQDHYMKPEMLQSQLETLEVPDSVLQIEITQTPIAIVQTIRSAFKL